MKYILTAVMALILSTNAYAELSKEQDFSNEVFIINKFYDVMLHKEFSHWHGPKIKPYGDDLVVLNPHIKDWYVPNEIKDAKGNIVGFEQVYNYSVIRFTDANGNTYNITFNRTPVTNCCGLNVVN